MSEALTPDVWTGPFRSPRNMAAEVKGSIHDDATAGKLGFRGGTVAGSVHMDQFVPRLLELYGPTWFETGVLSLYFTQATVDREEVAAQVAAGAGRARLSMHNRDGAQICTGTASAETDPESELVRRMAAQASVEPGRLRILADIKVGDEGETVACVGPERLAKHREIITEDLADYGRGVLPPSQVIGLAHQARSAAVGRSRQPHVGLFGALEVEHIKGPMMAGVEYAVRTRILKLTESPKTENAWYDVFLSRDGEDMGRVRFYLRFLKASSPLWS